MSSHLESVRPERRRPSFPLRRARPLIALAIGLALTGALAPAARACGMSSYEYVRRAPPPDPNQMIVQARRHLYRDEGLSALLRARAIVDRGGASDAVTAEAWAIISWVRWQRGQHASAVVAATQSRALDRTALDMILVGASDEDAVRAMRKALDA